MPKLNKVVVEVQSAEARAVSPHPGEELLLQPVQESLCQAVLSQTASAHPQGTGIGWHSLNLFLCFGPCIIEVHTSKRDT